MRSADRGTKQKIRRDTTFPNEYPYGPGFKRIMRLLDVLGWPTNISKIKGTYKHEIKVKYSEIFRTISGVI